MRHAVTLNEPEMTAWVERKARELRLTLPSGHYKATFRFRVSDDKVTGITFFFQETTDAE